MTAAIEIRELYLNFAIMAERIDKRARYLRDFAAAVSHEFKTPVAGVKGLLQSLALGSIPEAQRAELIQLGQIECDRLEHLAETILAYQRAMSREPGAGAQRIDAAEARISSTMPRNAATVPPFRQSCPRFSAVSATVSSTQISPKRPSA